MIPKPNAGEAEADFVGRCMGNETMLGEYPDQEQRAAVCYRAYREAHGNAVNPPITNREFALPKDDWYHICPLGNFWHALAGRLQVIDGLAVASMVNRFKAQAADPKFPGVLVDFDHFSTTTDHASEAAGWIVGLEGRADGLYANIRWSDTGKAAVIGGRYRMVSPSWRESDCEDAGLVNGTRAVRPLALHSLALTNDPNLRGLWPLSNRASEEKTGNVKGQSMNDKLIKLMGLPEGTAEEGVLRAIGEQKTKLEAAMAETGTLKNRVTELEAANKTLLEGQVESDLKVYEGRFKPEGREHWKAALLANRAGALELLKGLPEPASAALHNRAEAKVPGNGDGKKDADKPTGPEDAAVVWNRQFKKS